MAKNDITEVLCDLVALDFDAIEAYESAIDRLEDEASRTQLAEFKGDHHRHVQVLRAHVSLFGMTAPTSDDFKHFLTQGKVVLGSIVGDEGILKAMRSNKDTTKQKYEQAVKTVQEARQSEVLLFDPMRGEVLLNDLKRNLEDEHRHRVWIQARLSGMWAVA
jgi:hypothetical protein